jgi:two-component system CheB/CheR fusion protein
MHCRESYGGSIWSGDVLVSLTGAECRVRAPADDGVSAASLAHEINNPLDALLNLLCLLETEAQLTEEGCRYLALAREEVHRISQIAVGALSKVRQLRDTNVSALLRSVVEFYKSRFAERGISIQTRYCDDGNLAVFADPLRQAFSNLLLNAADSMPSGGNMYARISLAHEWSGQERRGLRVRFADSGSGIPREDMPRIFEPFFTTKGADGTGLGLSLVRDIVAKHGGVLRVRTCTRQGRSGSVFSMFLPVAPAPN